MSGEGVFWDGGGGGIGILLLAFTTKINEMLNAYLFLFI